MAAFIPSAAWPRNPEPTPVVTMVLATWISVAVTPWSVLPPLRPGAQGTEPARLPLATPLRLLLPLLPACAPWLPVGPELDSAPGVACDPGAVWVVPTTRVPNCGTAITTASSDANPIAIV
jgi:hypothetical protein